MLAQGSPQLTQRLKNLSASLLLMAAFGALYASIPYFRSYFSQRTPFLGDDYIWGHVLLTTALAYAGLLVLFYLFERAPRTSKSILCLRALRRIVMSPAVAWSGQLPADERVGLLSVLLKAFFIPLMIVWLFDHTASMIAHGLAILDRWDEPGQTALALFDAHGFWFMFKVILFLDVFFFTIGYMVELPSLKNEIRSVDPTLLGWTVALACYPPFNGMTAMVFGGGYSAEFPQFEQAWLHLTANGLLLALMAVYTSASIALNFKASNLTHRGIISHGPYRYIRHPAYTCKNLAWWIGLLPALFVALETSIAATLMTVGSMLGWSVIYYMRALTEEDHLRSVDGEYDAYCHKVKYRFIPGVI
ncbi:MAG: methyltransferase family protein [Thiobacillus sp.]